MNLAYNTISKSLSVLFLLCIIPSIYSRPFLDDVWGAVQYVLNGGSLSSIEKIPMNEELKQTGLNFIENKTVFYTKQVKQELKTEYTDIFNPMIIKEILKIIPETYSNEFFKDYKPLISQIKKRPGIHRLENETTEELYAKYENDINNFIPEFKELIRNKFYYDDTSFDFTYDLGMGMVGNKLLGKIPGVVKSIMLDEVGYFSGNNTEDFLQTAESELKSCGENKVNMDKTKVYSNKIEYVPWDIRVDVMFNSVTYKDDFDFTKANYNQEFSLVSQYGDYYCKTKVDSSLFNKKENKLTIMFPHNCIQPNQQSLSFTLSMNTKRKMKMITFIRTYTFTDINVTILDDHHILNNNILSNVYYDNEKNSFFAFSLLTLNQEYQSGDTIIEYSFNKKQYQRELLTSTNNYSLSLIKEQDSLIDFILYTKENKILFAVENCLLKSLGNMVEMFVEKNAYYGYNDNFYMKLLFNVDITNEHVDFYYNNEYIGKKIIGMNDIEIKLPKVDSNVISKITYKIGDVTYPGFSIYQGLIGGVDEQEIEKFLSEYFINTIKTYGLKLNEKQLNVIETYINEFRNQLNIISDSLCSQLEMINEFKEILSDVFSTIQDKCNNDETIEAFVTEILGDYSTINSGINKVIPGMNRNDIIQDTKEILGQVLVTKVSNEMLDVLAVQVSQGLFMYSDYELANILASKIKNKIIEIIKSECNNISTNHNIQQINDNAFIEIKQKQIVSWSPSNITIIFKEEQISFYKEETITIGLVRKNGVKMIWESSLTYPSALSEQTFTIPANTFKYIENEILPESNIYILAYKTETNIITIPNASIEVVKHITCPNPFKNALTSSITYIYDSFELYDSTYEAIIIENENTLLTPPQYGKVYSVIIPTETNILYANEEVIFIESITAVPDTYIYLSNSKTPIHITLKSNAYHISVSISTERDMIGVYQLENESTVISVDINEIILPSDKKLDFYLEYKRYKMKAFTIYISNYLSDINNKDITIPIFDTLYEWLPPCAQYSVKYSQIELFTQLQLTNLDTNISAFTSDYEVAIDEDNYEILIQNSLTDKFLEIHNDQSWKYKTYGKTYTALEILLDKMISLISLETINNTLITNVNDLITNNEIISNSISTFIETISQQLQNIVDTTNEDKYKSITKQIITEMTYIYTYKLLFTNIQAQYLNKLRSFTNTYITSFYNNNIITNKRFPININNPDIQTDKLDIIELNKVINLTLPYEYIANIERDEIYEFMLININSDKEACTVKADTSYLHSIILSFPSSCAAYNTNSEKNKYILGYIMNSTWLEHTIYNLYKFTNIIIESVDYKALPKADSSIFLNYELFPLNKYHFIQEPKQNPNTTDIFIQYRQSNKAFTSVPPSTVKSSLDFIVYNTTSKRILHADKGIVIISHKMRAINSKLLLKNAQNKVMSFGLVFDSNITDSKIINGIYQNREKLPCKQVNDTVITCNITSTTKKDFNLRGNNTSNNVFTNNITLSVIDEEDIWDNNQIQSCQYGLFAKDIKLNNNKPDLIKSLKASLISTDPPKSIDLLKTNHIITFPQIETHGKYNFILYDIDPDFPLISSPITFTTPHFDIANKHIQLEQPQSEEFAISINGVTCKQEEFKLKDKTLDQIHDIQCSSEINPQTSLYTCNINTKLNISNYELISGEHILDTLYVTIPFKNANFALTSIPLCVVALQGELNIFGITSSDYPVKFVDEVEFISRKQNTITKSSLELIENDSILSTSVAFENDDEYYITMKYNGAVIELKDIVIKPSLDFFSFNEDNYIIIKDSNKQPTSFDLYINLLFDYGDRKEIDFNIKDHSTVSCIIEGDNKCKITYEIDKPLEMYLSIPCSKTASSNSHVFSVYYFNSDYDDNKHKCFSIGTEEENKYYTLISPNPTNDNKLYYYISNENNDIVYEQMFPKKQETKINSKDILNKLNEGKYTFSIGKTLGTRKEIFKINRETLPNINQHGRLIAGFDSQNFNIVLNKESTQNNLISVTLKASNNAKLSLKCTFNSGNVLQCNNVHLSTIPQGISQILITNKCNDISVYTFELPWTPIQSLTPKEIDYTDENKQDQNDFVLSFEDPFQININNINIEFIENNKTVLTQTFNGNNNQEYSGTVLGANLPGGKYTIKASYNKYFSFYPNINTNNYYNVIPFCDSIHETDYDINKCVRNIVQECSECNSIGTKACSKINGMAYCQCNKDYLGILCEEKIENPLNTFNELINKILMKTELTPTQKSNIDKLITLTSEQKDSLSYQQELPVTNINIIRDYTVSQLKSNIPYNSGMLKLVTLTVQNEILKLKHFRWKNKHNLRYLEDTNESESDITESINNVLQLTANYFTNQPFDSENESVITTSNTYMHVQSWKNNKGSIEHASQNARQYNLTWIELDECLTQQEGKQYVFSKVEIPSETITEIHNSTTSNLIAIAIKELKSNNELINIKLDDISCDNDNIMKVSIPINQYYINDINFTEANKSGIDLFNKNSKIYTDSCFRDHDLPYDITPEEKKKLLSNTNIIQSIYESCDYDTIKLDNSTEPQVILKCALNNEQNIVGYSIDIYNKSLKDDSVFDCSDNIQHLEKNIAFWFYLIMFIFVICGVIVYFVLQSKNKQFVENITEQALINDKLIDNKNLSQPVKQTDIPKTESKTEITSQQKPNNNTKQQVYHYCMEKTPSVLDFTIKRNKRETQINNEQCPTKEEQNNTSEQLDMNQININTAEEDETFMKIFISNLKELHPIACLFFSSIITPFLIKIAFFTFNLFTLFGFNAVYYTNKYLNDRIKDSDRDNFAYPLKSEFGKIISAIITSMVLSAVMRIIILITYKRKEILSNDLKEGTKTRNEVIKTFNDEFFIKRIIVYGVMLVISVFFFYFTIAFCNRYPKAQHAWGISCFWSLFFNYILFSTVYIIIVSVLEKVLGNKIKECAYYAKRVFMF